MPDFKRLQAYNGVRVMDGDTIVVENGQAEEVRLVGVDTHETVHPTKPVTVCRSVRTSS
jgi:endonuclease YncB( thermonuclease family)